MNMLPVVVADMHCLLFVGCAPHNGESQKLSLFLPLDIQITPNFFLYEQNSIEYNILYGEPIWLKNKEINWVILPK